MSPENSDTGVEGEHPQAGMFLLAAAFFISGIGSLIVETIWTRILLLELGTTAGAVGVVLAAFMGGMGVGAYIAGRSERLRRLPPLLGFAWVEGLNALYILISPSLLIAIGFSSQPLAQYAIALFLLLPSTMAMGASLPFLSRAVHRQSSASASRVGWLYGVNTAGAVLGPLLSVFVLFPLMGVRATLIIASILVAFSAAIGYWLHSHRRVVHTLAPSAPVYRPSLPLPVPVVLAVAVSGASAMVYQIVWSRTLSMVFGSSIYGIAMMLSTFLFALATGSMLTAWWIGHRPKGHERLRLVRALVASSVLAFTSLIVARALPLLFLNLYSSTGGSDFALFVTQFAVAAILMLPPTLFLGAIFPLALSAAERDGSSPRDAKTGSSQGGPQTQSLVGRLYSWNLVGSTFGAVLGSTLLLASFGIEPTLRIAALVVLASALLLIARSKVFSVPWATITVGCSLSILALDPGGERVMKTFGVYADADAYASYDPSQLRDTVAAHQLLFYKDGPTATVAVQQIDRFKLLKINGKTDASNGPGDLQTQLLLGHVPLLFRPADEVAVIGWGSGTTVGAVLSHDVDSVHAFEIEPAVVEASRFFEPENGKPLEDPRVQLHVGDARHLLSRSTTRFDVIISEPSNPWLTGVSNLFTREFFEILNERLENDGLVCQWFHLYGMSEEATRSLTATFRSVFPHSIALRERDLILIGSQQPVRLSMDRLRSLFDDPKTSRSLAKAGLDYPADLVVELQLDDSGLGEYSSGGRINTDDNMFLELSAPKSLYDDKVGSIRAGMRRLRPDPESLIESSNELNPAELALELAASFFTAERLDEALRYTEKALSARESFDALKLYGQILDRLGRKQEARRALERALASGGDAASRRFVEAMIRSLPSPVGGG